MSEGATIVAGGGRPAVERGWYANPVLVGDAENRSQIAQEEIFGPVGVLVAYDGIDDGVARANDVAYGLAVNVCSPETAAAIEVARRLRAGTVYINGGGAFRPDAPFGGFKPAASAENTTNGACASSSSRSTCSGRWPDRAGSTAHCRSGRTSRLIRAAFRSARSTPTARVPM